MARIRTARVIAMSSIKVSVSVDVSIEQCGSRQSPVGSANPICGSHRHHRPCRGRTRSNPGGRVPTPALSPTCNGDSSPVGLGTAAEVSGQSSWLTKELHPRGGHGWLSATAGPPLTQLGKIEKMPPPRILGTLTSFKALGEPPREMGPLRGFRDADPSWVTESVTSARASGRTV